MLFTYQTFERRITALLIHMVGTGGGQGLKWFLPKPIIVARGMEQSSWPT